MYICKKSGGIAPKKALDIGLFLDLLKFIC